MTNQSAIIKKYELKKTKIIMGIHDKKVELLRTVELFSRLREYELDIISRYSEMAAVQKGHFLFSHGDPSHELYVVVCGRVGVIGLESEEYTIAQLTDADSFGELDFIGGTKRTATAFTEEDSVVLKFPADPFSIQMMLRDHAYISAHLMYRLLGIISERIWHVTAMLNEKTNWLHDLHKQLHRDKLTGLFNRTFLKDDFVNMLPGIGDTAALLMIKPDNFKQINDTCGHEAGDNVLRLMAIFLQSELGENDIAIRYSGDEFAAILADCGRDEAIARAKEISHTYDSMDLNKIVGQTKVSMRVSIGIALYPEETVDNSDLLKYAHAKMLKARSAGGNRIKI